MIVRPHIHWLRLIFIVRGSILRDITPQLLLTTAFAALVTYLHGQVFLWKVPLTFVPFSLIGLTLAIFLGFRNNTSYARYWEARQLWGVLLIETRALARQALTLNDDPGAAPLFIGRLAAFVHAVRHQLRSTDPAADLARLLPADDVARLAQSRNKAAVLLLMLGDWLAAQRRGGMLSPTAVLAMEGPLGRLGAAFGGCERIASTPIPFTYSVIVHRTIYTYCVLLPFGLVDSISTMTPVIVAFIAYTFFALEALGAEIEEPFGLAPNDLALDAMSWNIEDNLREAMGLPSLPPLPNANAVIRT
jgi:putative membrane protein